MAYDVTRRLGNLDEYRGFGEFEVFSAMRVWFLTKSRSLITNPRSVCRMDASAAEFFSKKYDAEIFEKNRQRIRDQRPRFSRKRHKHRRKRVK